VPEDHVHDLFQSTAWPGHVIGRPMLGTAASVGSMSDAKLGEFYRSGYVPDRVVVAVAGNVTHDRVAELVRSSLQPGTSVQRRTIGSHTPAFGGGVTSYDRRKSEQVHLVWGLPAVSRTDPDRYALSVLSVLYGGGMSSRLFQEVREKRGLAYSIYSAEHMYLETGSFTVYAGTQSETAAEVLKIVRAEAAAIASGDLRDDEVERAKGHVRGGLVLSMDDPGGRMSRLGRSELVHGVIPTVDELLDRVDAMTTADVERVAKRVFGASGGALASVGRVDKNALDFAVEPLGD
jgi:predicted Zn-dependent peptidase